MAESSLQADSLSKPSTTLPPKDLRIKVKKANNSKSTLIDRHMSES